MSNRSKSNKSGPGKPRQTVPVGNADVEHDYESPELTLVDLQNNISDLSNKICGKLDNLSEEVRSMSKKIEDLD